MQLFFNVDVDGVIVVFAALIAGLCALVCGLAPALRISRVDLVAVLNQETSTRASQRGRLRTGLVVAQVAVSLVLLVGAALVMRSLGEAARADPGFDPRQVAKVTLDLQQHRYDEGRGRAFYRDLLQALRADPAVESATFGGWEPLNIIESPAERLAVDGFEPPRGQAVTTQFDTIATGYFRTLKIPLLAGRDFAAHDDEQGQPVVIVNRTFADRFFGGPAPAIGRRIRVAGGDWRTVVGVAADIKYMRINEAPRPYVYLPLAQAHLPLTTLFVRGPADPATLVKVARSHVASLDPRLGIASAGPLTESTRASLMFFEITAVMLFAFGAAGMTLVAIGTYGLVACTVTQTTREIGIRMALGATAAIVLRAFLARSLRLGGAGAVLGTVVALGVTRWIGSLLFGVSPTDVVSFAGALALVLGGVLLATLVPAWRAARVDPLTAVRQQ
jgi:predicted permease